MIQIYNDVRRKTKVQENIVNFLLNFKKSINFLKIKGHFPDLITEQKYTF